MKRITFLICIAAFLGGCSKNFLNVNTNPNTPASTKANFAFTGAAITTGQTMLIPNQIGGAWTGIFGFSTSFTGAGQQKTYIFANSDFNIWDPVYDNITDYNYVVNNGVKDGFAYLVGPAIIMRSLQYQRLVDAYNNIPYFEAFNITQDVTPGYTKAQVVYEDLIKKLDSAITVMKATTFPTTATEDVIFKGNKTSWIQFANTLKLRILIRQSLIAGRSTYITTEIGKIVTEGTGLLTTNVLLQPGYAKTVNKLNPFYLNFGYNENDVEQTNHRFYKVGSYLINFLKGTQDTFRLQRKADMKAAGNNGNTSDFTNYVGVDLGQRSGASETVVSSIGSSLIVKGDATRPLVVFQASESYFLQAEAAFRYNLLGTPKTLFTNGVIESFKLDAGNSIAAAPTATVAAATLAANNYLARSGGDSTNYDVAAAAGRQLKAIIYQKWVALALHNNYEAWTEWRRTGYPAIPVSVQAQATQPRRFYYPISENNTNLENLNLEGTISPYTSRIFWDVR